MKIENIQVNCKYSNIWSVNRTFIQLRLNLLEMEHKPTNKVEGFLERMEKLMPTLYSHRCSPGVPGGFFQRVETFGTLRGTALSH